MNQSTASSVRTVGVDVVTGRLNRLMRKDGQVVRREDTEARLEELGEFYLAAPREPVIYERNVDLESFARSFELLKPEGRMGA